MHASHPRRQSGVCGGGVHAAGFLVLAAPSNTASMLQQQPLGRACGLPEWAPQHDAVAPCTKAPPRRCCIASQGISISTTTLDCWVTNGFHGRRLSPHARRSALHTHSAAVARRPFFGGVVVVSRCCGPVAPGMTIRRQRQRQRGLCPAETGSLG
jgi:hypothetical protein